MADDEIAHIRTERPPVAAVAARRGPGGWIDTRCRHLSPHLRG
ncbi:hypothetical protein [Streptomyces sp. NPDC058326]